MIPRKSSCIRARRSSTAADAPFAAGPSYGRFSSHSWLAVHSQQASHRRVRQRGSRHLGSLAPLAQLFDANSLLAVTLADGQVERLEPAPFARARSAHLAQAAITD